MNADDVANLLDLRPLPGEGGLWAQTHRDDHSSAIYFLLRPGDHSALHRLDGPELYHHYAGDPAELVTIDGDGRLERRVLGDDLASGARPVALVAADVWQGSATLGRWSLLGTTMAPPYRAEGWELADPERLAAAHPDHAGLIRRLGPAGRW